MIQLIQTLYLALVLIFSFVGLISTSAEWTVADKVVADFGSFTFNAYPPLQALDTISGPWCLGILLLIVIFLSAMSIMLFRKRMRQLRLTIVSTILLVGYIATYAAFAYYYQLHLEQAAPAGFTPTLHIKFISALQVISVILNCLAIQGIRKDEALVRSLDRIR